MSSKSSKFPAFARAVESHTEGAQLRREIAELELSLKGLALNPQLPPREAARDFVERETKLNADLRERRLALAVADPDTSPLWRAAASEMRPEAERIDDALLSLVQKAKATAADLLSTVARNPEFMAEHSTLVMDANALLSEFRHVFFVAINTRDEGIAGEVTALHTAIEETPTKIKAIESLLSKYQKATGDLHRTIPAEVKDAEEAAVS